MPGWILPALSVGLSSLGVIVYLPTSILHFFGTVINPGYLK